MDASLGVLPRSICFEIFSSTTMASATTIPMAIDNADNEMILMVLLDTFRYMKAAIREIGMVRIMINVARHRPRKNITTSNTKIKANISVSDRLLMESVMN